MIKDTILIVTDMIKMGDIMTIILFMFQGKNHTMLIIINILEVMMITIIITTMITKMDTTIIITMITMIIMITAPALSDLGGLRLVAQGSAGWRLAGGWLAAGWLLLL